MIIIGIDPGASGAICAWCEKLLISKKCPDSAEKMSNIVLNIKNISYIDGDGKVLAYLEKVWARPSNATRAAFHFGENYGRWQGVLESHKIPINYVLPNTWMKYWSKKYDLKLPKDYSEKKKKLKELASYQTDKKVTLYNSDAILIAAYGFKLEQDKINERRTRA